MATRIEKLAQPKPNRLRYSDRRSVYWLDKLQPETTAFITKTELTPRWSELCRGKKFYTQVTRSPIWELNRATQTAVATSRICQLAQPKRRLVLEGSGHRSKPVPLTHMPCKASAHIELLATPKHDHPKFEGERSELWLVSKAARHHVASQRILELSSPKERKALFEGYDPYVVSRAARSASPSTRIRQLSLPLPRKCTSH